MGFAVLLNASPAAHRVACWGPAEPHKQRVRSFLVPLVLGTRIARKNYCPVVKPEEAHMPAIIIPVLWVGGAAVLLGGGWYVIGHMVH